MWRDPEELGGITRNDEPFWLIAERDEIDDWEG